MEALTGTERFENFRTALCDKNLLREKLDKISDAVRELYEIGFDVDCSMDVSDEVKHQAVKNGFRISVKQNGPHAVIHIDKRG